MRKQDVLDVHAFLVKLRDAAVAAGVPAGAFAEYEMLGVAPTDTGRPKGAHADAVAVLTRELRAVLGDRFGLLPVVLSTPNVNPSPEGAPNAP